MRIGPIYRKDKLNRTVTLRSAETEDAEALLRYIKITAGETPFLIREPDEVTLTLEQEQAFIRNKLESPRELLLIAEINGEHIGNCSVGSMGIYRRYAHRCDIAVALYRKYCNAGIGGLMLETALETAAEMGYEQAELEVVSSNRQAISLYRRFGFPKYGIFPGNMKYADGTYEDADWMMLELKKKDCE